MRIVRNPLLFFIAIILIAPSCTLTKRRYSRGFHVDWFFGGKRPHSSPALHPFGRATFAKPLPPIDCDTIVLLSGDTLLVNAIELDTLDIHYVTCDQTDSSSTRINRELVRQIGYENGPRIILNRTEMASQDSTYVLAEKRAELAIRLSVANLLIMFLAPSFMVLVFLVALTMAISANYRAPKPLDYNLRRKITRAYVFTLLPLILITIFIMILILSF